MLPPCREPVPEPAEAVEPVLSILCQAAQQPPATQEAPQGRPHSRALVALRNDGELQSSKLAAFLLAAAQHCTSPPSLASDQIQELQIY